MTLDGQPFDLATYRGRPVIVNFWGPSCIPCRDEFPQFLAKLQQHAADGLAIVGVLTDDPVEPARAFVAQYDATWPTVVDPEGRIKTEYRVVRGRTPGSSIVPVSCAPNRSGGRCPTPISNGSTRASPDDRRGDRRRWADPAVRRSDRRRRRLAARASAGEVVALLGPNGAGKTTTVEIVEGYRRADSGSVRVLGVDPWRAGRAHAARVGLMLQDGGMTSERAQRRPCANTPGSTRIPSIPRG